MSNCAECTVQGPQICDKCDENYWLVESLGAAQQCKSTQCELNFKFNTETGECEDTVCKKSNCLECQVSGIYDGCDRCKDGFFFDQLFEECKRDGTCNVERCAKCETDPAVCEQCTTGFWLDIQSNQCLDGTCQVQNC